MHAYQGDAVDFLLDNPSSALFIDTGLGKTVIVLTLIVLLFLKLAFGKILIVAPMRVAIQTWPTEIGLWDHTFFLNYRVIRVDEDNEEAKAAGREAAYWATSAAERRSFAQRARTAKRREIRERYVKDKASIHIINREALPWLVDQFTEWKVKKGRRPQRKIIDWPYDVVIVDESSSFKDHKTNRFRALAAVVQQGFIKRLHELTATPAAENYMGIFAQIFLMDVGARFGRNITKYRRDYFDYNEYSRVYTLKPGAKERISDKIADICLVMQSSDYLDEEEPLFLTRRIDLEEHELQQYKRFERDFLLTLEDGEIIEAETASALSGKLLQLASGAVYDKQGEARIIHSHKIEDLAQLAEELEEAGEPLLVAYWYKSSLARLRKAFPHAVVMDKAGKCLAAWNAGKIKMLLVQPASVGHGLNMQLGPGHDLYMYDMCWSWELFYQLYRRLHRQGQKRRVRVHLATAIGTNDEVVGERLDMKEDAQQALFERIKRLWRIWKQRQKVDRGERITAKAA